MRADPAEQGPTATSLATAAANLAEEDLPAPVASTRPFTFPPRGAPTQRIVIKKELGTEHELENSVDLDLPHPNDLSALPPAFFAARPRHETLSPGLGAKDTASPTQPEVTPRPLPRLPPPRSRRALATSTPRTPNPTPAAYGGLLGLFAAFISLWWLYFSGGEDLPRTGDLMGHVRKFSTHSPLGDLDLASFESLLNSDRIEDYQAALTLSEARSDVVGSAEAALRIHLRYGPDPVRAAQADAWLATLADFDDPRLQRVRSLAALAHDDPESATRLLNSASEPWGALYRGLLAYRSGDFSSAQAFAASALSQRPDDHAAHWLTFAAAIKGDRQSDLGPLREALAREPQRPALQLLLIDALIGRGLFAEARRRLDSFARPPGVSDAHHATLLMQHARVAAATVEMSRSVYWAEEAIRQTSNPEITRAALRLMIEADELGRAQQGLTALLRSAPSDPEAIILQAELALRAKNESAAARVIDRLISHPTLSTTLLYYRGRLALLGTRLDEAAAHFLAAASAEQPNFLAGIEYAKLSTSSHASEGLALLDRLLDRLQHDPREHLRRDARALALARVHLLEATGQHQAASTALDEALTRDPDDNTAQLHRGTLLLTSGQVDAGREDLLAVFQRTGGYPGLIGPLTNLLIQTGELSTLEEMLQPQISDARAPDEVILAVAQLRLAQGAVEAADSLADNILLRNPSSAEALMIKNKVRLSRKGPSLAPVEPPPAPDPKLP